MKKIAVIGLGLIGGSVSLALKRKHKDKVYIYGYDLKKEHLSKALNASAIDQSAESIVEAVKEADIIIVATPVSSIKDVFQEISASENTKAVVTDVCSLKSIVCELAKKYLLVPENFIGGHPMAGSEKGGFDAAHHEIFVGRPYILTPLANTSEKAMQEAHWLIKSLGAKPAVLSPEEHDFAVAYSSHLTHLISWAIVSVALSNRTADIAAKFGGPSFREMTRVSMSSPELWAQILVENREKIQKAAELFLEKFNDLKKELEEGDTKSIQEKIKAIRDKRFEIYRVSEAGGKIYRLEVVLPNKPGQLAKVTSILSKEGINIENIEMMHGEGQGLLFVDISGKENAELALKALRNEGFEASVGEEI